MSDDEIIPDPKKVLPHQLGWLRRPELDRDNIEVWELPDGKLYANEKNRKLELAVWRPKDWK